MPAKTLANPVTLEFPRGRYTVYLDDSPKRELHVSNTVGRFPEVKVKNIAVLIEDVHDLVADGMGSELVFHGRATQFAVIASTHVSIRNFATDWNAPLVLDLTVLAIGVGDGHVYRDLKLPAGVGVTIEGATATFHGETSPTTGLPYWSHGPEVASEWANQIRELATGQTLRSPLPRWEGSRAVSEWGNNVIRISYDTGTDPGGAGNCGPRQEAGAKPPDWPISSNFPASAGRHKSPTAASTTRTMTPSTSTAPTCKWSPWTGKPALSL